MSKKINFKLIENSKYNSDIRPSILYLLRKKKINYSTIVENEELILLFFVEVANFDFFKREIRNRKEYKEYENELTNVINKTFSDFVYMCHLNELNIIKDADLHYSIFEYMQDVKRLFSEFFRFSINKDHFFIKMRILNKVVDKHTELYLQSII